MSDATPDTTYPTGSQIHARIEAIKSTLPAALDDKFEDMIQSIPSEDELELVASVIRALVAPSTSREAEDQLTALSE